MLQHSVLPPGHSRFKPSREDKTRYTLLAYAPDGTRALVQHSDQPADAFWHWFDQVHVYRLAGDPENEFTGPDWISDFGDLCEGAGPEFDTIDEVRQYLWGAVHADG